MNQTRTFHASNDLFCRTTSKAESSVEIVAVRQGAALVAYLIAMTLFLYWSMFELTDRPIVYWSVSKSACERVSIGGVVGLCEDFDFDGVDGYDKVFVE